MSNRTLSLPHDISLSVAQPYSEGHVLTANEAEKLNHVYADSIRTSLMAKLKRLAETEGFDAAAVQAEFQFYADAYSFVVRAPKASADPVEKEARKIAKSQVFAAIRRKGGNPADYSDDQIAEYISKVLALKPEIREEAARRIDSSRKIAGDMLADIFDEAA